MNRGSVIALAWIAATAAGSAIASLGTPDPDVAPDFTATKSPARVFSVTGLAPGSRRTDSVAFTNQGPAPEELRLSQTVGAVSPAQRELRQNLGLRVIDAAHEITVYSGPLVGLTERSLGRFQPGQTRRFRFVIALSSAAPDSTQGVGLTIPVTWSFVTP